MSSAIEKLLALVAAGDRYDIPHADLLPLQLQAADERLQSRVGRIRLLASRAGDARLSAIGAPADLVPLLFAHTSYKSYAESWLAEGRWDRMSKWVETVSTHPTAGVDLGGVRDIDDWIVRLQKVGHFVGCSSGTTGKPAILSCSQADMDVSGRMNVSALSWATGIAPQGDRRSFSIMPPGNNMRNEVIRRHMVQAFSSDHPAVELPAEPVTIGKTTGMIALRRRIADGTARPAEIAEFEALSASRQASMDGAVQAIVETLIESRGLKLQMSGLWAMYFQIAQAVRERGFGGRDFHPENELTAAGGLKGAVLPSDYKEYVLETFNVSRERLYHFYSMQEINTPFPLCRAGRYHIAPWVMLLPLDREGEVLLAPSDGEIEGRAAFFDISLDGRWGGVISGDHIHARFGPCDCGARGPSVGLEITRYADMIGGDKISCSGTIDAYIRGATSR